jgi:hypothetical protein
MEPATCAACGSQYRPYFRLFERFFWRRACPNCRSRSRSYTQRIQETLLVHEAWSGKIKNDAFRSKQKLRGWFFFGHQWSVRRGKFVRKSVSADKRTDEYHEKITDIESGEVIHECHEKLRDHVGHGSAKFKQGEHQP